MALSGRAGVDVAVVERDVAGLGPQLGDVESGLVFGAHDDGQVDLLVPNPQFGHLAHRGFPFWHTVPAATADAG